VEPKIIDSGGNGLVVINNDKSLVVLVHEKIYINKTKQVGVPLLTPLEDWNLKKQTRVEKAKWS
jgi:hypothetical protein